MKKTRWYGGDALCLLLLTVLIRGGVLLMTPGALRGDPDGYRALAENLRWHGTLGADARPSAYRPPLFPVVLAGCLAFGGDGRVAIGLLHLVLGVATVGLVLRLGHWWGLGRRGAALAALMVACDPILVYWSTQVMTETLATFLAVAGLFALTRVSSSSRHTPCAVACGGNARATMDAGGEPTAQASSVLVGSGHVGDAGPVRVFSDGTRSVPATVLAGVLLGLSALCRPTFLLWAVAVGIALWWSSRRSASVAMGRRIAGRLCLPAAFALGVVLVLTPWAIRNKLQLGQPIITTTHGGYTLLLANNPSFYQWLRAGQWGTVWEAGELSASWEQRRRQDELQADREARAEAWQTIRQEPASFAYACLVHAGRLWSPLPHRTASIETLRGRLWRYGVAAWYLAEFVLAAVGVCRIWRSRGRLQGPGSDIHHSSLKIHSSDFPPSPFPSPPSSSWLWGLLLVLCLTTVHTVYWTDMRMRAPVMPVVAMAAAAGLVGRSEKRHV